MPGSTPKAKPDFPLEIPEEVRQVHETLTAAGHRSVLAGGAVRDYLLGSPPMDFDLATSAVPEEVDQLFQKTVLVGAQFGVVKVLIGDVEVEVATFRADIGSADGRHPEAVRFTDEKEDALRRDFTINGLFWDIDSEEVVDHVGGLIDLEKGIIRAIGNPVERFREDRLRMMRAIRFSTVLDFPIDEKTWQAIIEESAFVKDVSSERIRTELEKTLISPHRKKGYEMLSDSGLMKVFLPEIEEMKDVQQPPQHHPEGDVHVHTGLVIHHLEDPSPTLVMGALLHDVGKPGTFEEAPDRIRFHGHDELGAKMSEEICERLKFSRKQQDRIVYLVRRHLVFMNVPNMRLATRYRLFEEEGFQELLDLCKADCLGSHGDMSLYETCKQMYEEWQALGPPTEPLLQGRDLIALGMKPGPGMGAMLEALDDARRESVITDKESATQWVKDRLSAGGSPESSEGI
ncbi:MAG: HDIG domain-containing protein [Proteobacteria bacterium]|jgi:poly(A) polymerase|nr:HDIG domain-containing protein [Planctomycetia bacterium]NCG55742.1 HDIG domain-containing protein [Pseudomonadota bacterium]